MLAGRGGVGDTNQFLLESGSHASGVDRLMAYFMRVGTAVLRVIEKMQDTN